jgi:hypothetical protein
VRGMARRHHWTRPVPEVGWRRMPSPAGAGEGPGTASGRRPLGGALSGWFPLCARPLRPALPGAPCAPGAGSGVRYCCTSARARLRSPPAGVPKAHGLHRRRDRQRPAIGKAQPVRPAVHIRPPVVRHDPVRGTPGRHQVPGTGHRRKAQAGTPFSGCPPARARRKVLPPAARMSGPRCLARPRATHRPGP